ncbi:MAG: hypothetical protein R3277_02675 [Brumimicrobium sp.]|nr:hypothetical protein [Brumimicrobium sp.]
MKITKRFILAFLTTALVFGACKKEEPTDPTVEPTPAAGTPSSVDLMNYFSQNQASEVQNFSGDAGSIITITGNKGTQLSFQANSFETASGNTVTGMIDIELIEIFDKAGMIRLNKPTTGLLPGGGFAPLTSGGEFKVTAYQNGQELKLKSGYGYNAIVPAPGGVDPNMGLFYGSGSEDTLIWEEADSGFVWGQGSEYSCYFDSLNWINCDYFWNNPNPQTTVSVEIPQGFNNTNCMVFISFDGLNSITTFYNYSNGAYTSSPNYTLPIGIDVHFVAVAFINGNPHVAIIPATIENNHYEIISQLNQTTLTQFESDLNNLP